MSKEESSDPEEQERNCDSDDQQSGSESSDNSVLLEMDDDSTSLSQASSEKQSEASEKNRVISTHISPSGDLEGKLLFTECVRAKD
jgi:hypothetical protein